MSAGGFNLNIGFGWTAAQASLQQFQQYATNTFNQVNRAAQVTPQINTQAAQQQANQLRNTLQQLGNVRTQVRLEGAETTAAQLRNITTLANTLSSTRAQIQLSISGNSRQQFEQEIARARQFLQNLNAGDTATLDLRLNNALLQEGLQLLRNDIRQVEQRGVNLRVNATQDEGRGLGSSILGGAGRGIVSGSGLGGSLLIGAGALTATAAAGVAAAVAVEKVTSATISALEAGVKYNAVLETQTNTFRHFTESAAEASTLMRQIREAGLRAGVGEQEALTTGAGFLRASGGDIERARELTEITTALAAARPEIGFERVRQAIQQLASGDFLAFEDTMNIAIGSVRQLGAQGVTGMDLIRQGAARAGLSMELLAKNADTFTVRMNTLSAVGQSVNAAFGRALFTEMTAGLGQLTEASSQSRDDLNALAEVAGQGLGQALRTTFPILQQFTNLLGTAAAAGRFLRERGIGEPIPGSEREQQQRQTPGGGPRTVGTVAEIRANREEGERLTGEIAKQTVETEKLERAVKQVQNAAKQVTAEYEVQLVHLQNQLKVTETPNFGLQRANLEDQLRVTRAQRAVELAQGDPQERARLSGRQAALDAQRELLDIQHDREDLARNIAAAEQRVAQNAVEAQIRAAQAGLEAQRNAAQRAQDVRARALEGLREEVRGQQEARDVALERLREEVRGHQEARDAATERLREEVRGHQEARDVALERLREETREAQEARQVEIEAFRESIQEARDAYDERKELRQEELREAEEAFQERRREQDLEHRASQDRLRDRIESLREADQAEQESARRRTAAELALQALERQRAVRQREIQLRDAVQNVLEARTGRDLRHARQRLLDVREEQTFEVERERLRDQVQREEDAREERRNTTRREIQALERQARQEDRQYQAERAREEDDFRRKQQEAQRQLREDERAEKAARREEDQQLRELERTDRELRRGEEALIREEERKDRELTRQENATVRAQEQADRELTRQENATIREQERQDRELTRQENEQIRQQEITNREADRADQEAIRQETERISTLQRENAEITANIQDQADRDHLTRLQDSYDLDSQRLDVRQQIADLKDIPALEAATAEAAIAGYLETASAHLVKVDELTRAMQALPLREQIAGIEAEMAGKVEAFEQERIRAEARLSEARTRLDTLKSELEEVRREQTRLQGAPGPVQGPGLGHFPEEGDQPVRDLQPQSWLDTGTQLANSFMQGLSDAFTWLATGEDPLTKWAGEAVSNLHTTFEWDSPSRLTTRLGEDLMTGFTDGVNQNARATIDALEGPFIEFQDVYMPAFLERMPGIGTQAAQAFVDGFNAGNISVGISNSLNDAVNFFTQYDESFRVSGYNLAINFQNGWTDAMAEWQPYVPMASGGGGYYDDGSGSYSGRSGSSFGGYAQQLPGTDDITRYLEQHGWRQEYAGFGEAFDDIVNQIYNLGYAIPEDMLVTGRAVGGMMNPGMAYQVHKNEVLIPEVPTLVLNENIVGGIASVIRGAQQPTRGTGGPVNVSVTNHINGANMDPAQIADVVIQRTIPAIVNILEAAQEQAPRPISRFLPGAE